MITPKAGDRIIIKNIPQDYHYHSCYEGIATIDNGWNGKALQNSGHIGFYTGYVPYKDADCLSISGTGHGIHISKMRYLKKDQGKFWKFKNGIRRAHNGEEYTEEVNYFEVNFEDLE